MIQGFSGGLLNRQLIYQTDLPSFQRDFASLKTLDHGTGPAITFTRASGATYFDADGVLQTATNDAPRFDHDPATGASRGLLIEEARTNSLPNSQMTGAAAGSPGTVPTGWNMTTALRTIATGTLNGFSYIDVTYNGTASGLATNGMAFDPQTNASGYAAASGQSWSGSVYVALIAGSLPAGVVINLITRGRTSANAPSSPADATTTSITPTATLTRYSATRLFNNAATEKVTLDLRSSAIADGISLNFTLRIAAPQLEQGAFPTSYIPTTTAAATRAADSAIVTPVSSFYNQAEGTLYAAFRPRTVTGTRTLVAFDNDTEDEQVRLRNVDTDPRLTVNDGGVEQANIDAGTVAAETVYGLTGAFKLDDFAASINGATVVTDTSGTMPTITHLRIGNSKAGNIYNGAIAKVAYWPKRLSNTLLEQLST
jgi:hypothetical protein